MVEVATLPVEVATLVVAQVTLELIVSLGVWVMVLLLDLGRVTPKWRPLAD